MSNNRNNIETLLVDIPEEERELLVESIEKFLELPTKHRTAIRIHIENESRKKQEEDRGWFAY